MVVLVKGVERIEKFENENHIVVNLKLLNCKDMEKQAKEIDKNEYSKDCFVAEFLHKNGKLNWLNGGINYIDNMGNHNKIDTTKIIENNVIRCVANFIENKGV